MDIAAEIGKVLGPLTVGLGMLVSWNAQRRIAILLETQLAVAAGKTAGAAGAGAAGRVLTPSALLAGGVAMGGRFALAAGGVAASVGAGFAGGSLLAKSLGLPTAVGWYNERRRGGLADVEGRAAYSQGVVPEVTSSAINVYVTLDGEQLSRKVSVRQNRTLGREMMRQ